MTIIELASAAGPFQRFARCSWKRPFEFWHVFNANGQLISADSFRWPLSQRDLLADDWIIIEKEDLAA